MRRPSSAAALVGLLLGACSTSQTAATSASPAMTPQLSGRAELGQRLAGRLCSRCHQVGAAGDSPNSAAPPFSVLAVRYSEVTLGRKLDDIATGHYEMPPTRLTNDEIDSVVAYLKTFSGD